MSVWENREELRSWIASTERESPVSHLVMAVKTCASLAIELDPEGNGEFDGIPVQVYVPFRFFQATFGGNELSVSTFSSMYGPSCQ